ncbi:ABC transporter permease subunit [Brevibacterium sp. 5221]|uniref:ABC transporter permease subunit n=1 Tax=Brevibacterium rongguiense TaxID=2695267 RepID=A0A6N9HB04_9MICO|nr:ABC transporter permease subunit [Brevibacterium rongguiense]MYM20674.1 ABC transporter permease subunit [Brevibacterium rongguiense]
MRWGIQNIDIVAGLFAQHALLAILPTVIGLLLAVPLAAVLRGRRAARTIAVVIAGIVFTIPSLALFVVIPAVIGTAILNPANVVIALSLYSLALLLRTALDALDAVPRDVREAAEAMGYGPLRRTLTVDLALAVPVLLPGLRVVAVTNVSMVSVGAVIGVGGLGNLFTTGYQRSYPDQIIAGLIAILVLALVVDRVLALIGWALTRWARAGDQSAAAARGAKAART